MQAARPIFLLLATMVILFSPYRTAIGAEQVWPRTVKHEAGELTLKTKPVRIVSTTPSITGILLAMGAPLVATAATTPSPLTDNKGFFLQWADVADERGVEVLYPNLEFDMEAIIGFEPDLLIASATGADSVVQHYSELKAQGIPTLVVNYSNQSWQEIATQLGTALGLEDETGATIARFDAKVAVVAATITPPSEPVTIVGYNIGNSYSVGRISSPQSQLLQALGFKVDGLPDTVAKDVTRRSDFDFISHENLSAAITGKSIFLLRGSQNDVQALLKDPVLANLPAVRDHNVYPLGPSSFRIDYYSGLQMIEAVASNFPK
ncbi:Fe2+-enterobactin ABC transporter substrate-binding protein [Ochrobactrum sp. WV_118_8]|uniref:Fe2+-enterobactin ABC transporter substrate-binding protein n=1 Tax=Brucella TaxID=234 RepID=UPI00044B5779|nr:MULTISPECIES: Fe2+-enterobactin ABC transporter substrate-binding protein [Brucella/Ochrobactrum group]QOD65985.1 Fe2+-enterobactin ABC transporter substrate-binding protein [Ochrobactrum sp. MT180101]QTN04440.1 Fe2+-enterobactin ABC transporter substrate-binding protein [Ochrobactrum sp. EEELCW01]EXL02770.1 antibiotic ABC transporter substrate-binding protein [Brucella anthropi]KAB2792419.1 Fe2+-enterobactin ABC transporter substrate-binding protein [Brucella anthropi]KIU70317.1 antibiotic